ncbi:MAG: transporter substrate-binding domain-containing protein, partial [Thermoanaerobaculia bacterium]|nr:transporter substrate-binding domain-containing protein [Thermoanaerobaculia bacterium]
VTKAGRALALVWMFTSLVAISSLTAAITSALTLNELQSGISGPADLPEVTVGSVADSTSIIYLEERGVSSREYESAEGALEALKEGEVQAVVYDAPILRYRIKEDYPGELMILPETFVQQNYGVAFGSGSPLREPFNRTLLSALESRDWREIVARYLGADE